MLHKISANSSTSYGSLIPKDVSDPFQRLDHLDDRRYVKVFRSRGSSQNIPPST